MDTSTRHAATAQIAQYFAYDHLPPHLAAVSQILHDAAADVLAHCPDGPETTTGLRKLLEAKDCFVRSALDKARA